MLVQQWGRIAPQRKPRAVASFLHSNVVVTGVVLLFTGESSHRFEPPAKSAGACSPSWAFAPGPGQLGFGLVSAF